MDATTVGGIEVSVVARSSWKLIAVRAGELRELALPASGVITIGRGGECDVVLDHQRVSRLHARVRVDGDACVVEDLGSRNGTRVGEAIAPHRPAIVRAGEAIGIGPFTLVAVREPAARAVAGSAALAIADPTGAQPSAVLRAVARSAASVLIRGESGAGKQVLAETLHRLSGRPGSLLSINCSAIGGELLESELFGHERGAFTGAIAAKPGLLEVAGEGTVLLDEIGDMPPPLQAKLLRAVESREMLRVGGTRPLAIGARFLAATHRDLLRAVDGGGFRLDLYYRLAAVTLTVPALRERRGQLAALARELVAVAAARDGRPAPVVSAAAMARLAEHAWPGNVRELRNVIDRALILAPGAAIDAEHVVFDRPAASVDCDERARIIEALARCSGNQTRAAKLLGVSRSTLATKLAIHRIPRPRA